MNFTYKGYKNGQLVKGEIQSNNRKEAIIDLKKQGITVTYLKEQKQKNNFLLNLFNQLKGKFVININLNIGKKEQQQERITAGRYINKTLENIDIERIENEEDIFEVLDDKFEEKVSQKIEQQAKNESILTREINLETLTSLFSSSKRRVQQKRGKVKPKYIMNFTKQFAVLLKTGVPLIKSLQILIKQTNHDYFKKMLAYITKEVAQGNALSRSMGIFSDVFTNYYIAMIRTGEETGALTHTLELLYEDMFKKQKLKGKIISALIYPAFLLCVFIGALLVISLWVAPKIITAFEGFELPGITKIVFAILFFINKHIFIFIGFFVFLFFGLIIQYKNNYKFKFFVHSTLLNIPVLGNVIKDYYTLNFLRTLNICFKNGISLVKALDIAQEVITLLPMKVEIEAIKSGVIQGVPMSAIIEKKSNVFSLLATQTVRVGEESGNLQEVFDTTISYLEWNIENFIETFQKWIEPAALLIIVVGIAIVVLAVYLPILSMSSGATMGV